MHCIQISMAEAADKPHWEEQLRSLVKQHETLAKRAAAIAEVQEELDIRIMAHMGDMQSVDVPLTDMQKRIMYRVQKATTTRRHLEARSVVEAYGADAYDVMSVVVSKANELMKKGTQEQFDIAKQGMTEIVSKPFVRISIVKEK